MPLEPTCSVMKYVNSRAGKTKGGRGGGVDTLCILGLFNDTFNQQDHAASNAN
jgi:hypothetical protein